VSIDSIQEPPQLAVGIMIVLILRQVNFILFDRADEPLGITVLPGCSDLSHTDPHLGFLEEVVVDAEAYIGDSPEFAINKSAWLDEIEESDILTYTIHMVNLGLQATDVMITDTIPANTTYVPGSASGDGELVNDHVCGNSGARRREEAALLIPGNRGGRQRGGQRAVRRHVC
jgi:uncharacterized repeat protein (TIGR01451 family)